MGAGNSCGARRGSCDLDCAFSLAAITTNFDLALRREWFSPGFSIFIFAMEFYMLDINDGQHGFLEMLREAYARNQLGAVERPSDPYVLCWCRSGRKWKFCHKDRANQRPMPYGQARSEMLSFDQVVPCAHPLAGPESCSSYNSIRSHTIQRRGGLGAIAENGHVYSTRRALLSLEKRDGIVTLEKEGVFQASTFPGFCSKHDAALFRDIELPHAELSPRNSLLLSYRAVVFEKCRKEAQLSSSLAQRDFIDAGVGFEHQRALQNMEYESQVGMRYGCAEVARAKGQYDKALNNDDLSGYSFYGILFESELPFVVCGAFFPATDFSGNWLQSPSQPDHNLVTLNVSLLGGVTCAVLGWYGGVNGAAAKLVDSLRAVPAAEKANAVLTLAVEYLENFYCNPTWWDNLPSNVSSRLYSKIAGGVFARSQTALVEPELGAIAVDAIAEVINISSG